MSIIVVPPDVAAVLLAPEVPFPDRMVPVILAGLAIAAALLCVISAAAYAARVTTDGVSYNITSGFNVAAPAVIAILIILYSTWW